jgi:hypothetical protein
MDTIPQNLIFFQSPILKDTLIVNLCNILSLFLHSTSHVNKGRNIYSLILPPFKYQNIPTKEEFYVLARRKKKITIPFILPFSLLKIFKH